MSLQTIAIVVDVPEDQSTAVESAAAAAVTGLQDAGVVVVAASFAGTSLLPTPAEALRAAIAALQELSAGSKPPAPADLAAAVAKVDDAARIVEAAGAGPVPTAPTGDVAPTALPDEAPAAPTAPSADASA